MPRPVGLHASVSISAPERRVVLRNRHGEVDPDPDWVSLDVLVKFELDDGTLVGPSEATHVRGGPLDFSRRDFEEEIRGLLFSEPRYLPDHPLAEPAHLVSLLRAHGIDSTVEVLDALPLTISVSDEVEARRALAAQG